MEKGNREDYFVYGESKGLLVLSLFVNRNNYATSLVEFPFQTALQDRYGHCKIKTKITIEIKCVKGLICQFLLFKYLQF